MSIILTPEQKGLRLLDKRHSEDGQMAVLSRAIDRAMNGVNNELLDEGARPSFTAVLGALGNALAGHLARLDDPAQRAELTAAMLSELPQKVEAAHALREQAKAHQAGRG